MNYRHYRSHHRQLRRQLCYYRRRHHCSHQRYDELLVLFCSLTLLLLLLLLVFRLLSPELKFIFTRIEVILQEAMLTTINYVSACAVNRNVCKSMHNAYIVLFACETETFLFPFHMLIIMGSRTIWYRV